MNPTKPDHDSINAIKATLLRIKAISTDNIEILSNRTRDNPNLNVFKDKKTGVIFIDEFLAVHLSMRMETISM